MPVTSCLSFPFLLPLVHGQLPWTCCCCQLPLPAFALDHHAASRLSIGASHVNATLVSIVPLTRNTAVDRSRAWVCVNAHHDSFLQGHALQHAAQLRPPLLPLQQLLVGRRLPPVSPNDVCQATLTCKYSSSCSQHWHACTIDHACTRANVAHTATAAHASRHAG